MITIMHFFLGMITILVLFIAIWITTWLGYCCYSFFKFARHYVTNKNWWIKVFQVAIPTVVIIAGIVLLAFGVIKLGEFVNNNFITDAGNIKGIS